ncbi:hypothetical protein IRZ53_13835 [Pseudomonas fulva]|nr:hypothetical protein [Pseudomonas fulva]
MAYLRSTIAAETRFRSVYERLINVTDDPPSQPQPAVDGGNGTGSIGLAGACADAVEAMKPRTLSDPDLQPMTGAELGKVNCVEPRESAGSGRSGPLPRSSVTRHTLKPPAYPGCLALEHARSPPAATP